MKELKKNEKKLGTKIRISIFDTIQKSWKTLMEECYF